MDNKELKDTIIIESQEQVIANVRSIKEYEAELTERIGRKVIILEPGFKIVRG